MAVSWVRLNENYFHDDAIADAGPLAELLYVRSLAWCAGSLTDGHMSASQVRRIIGVDLDRIDELASRLVDAGLWERDHDRGGFQVRQWLKYNKSAEDISKRRSLDAGRKRSSRMAERSPAGLLAESAPHITSESPAPEGQGRTLSARTDVDRESLRAQVRETARRATARRVAGA